MKFKLSVFLFVLILLVACKPATEALVESDLATAVPTTEHQGGGMGANSAMRDRHHAPIPDEYASLVNPVTSDDESLARGAAIYGERCLVCHGETGQGDGPAGAALNPAPAAIAHTSQMMSDAYLFYRISEGGLFAPFNSVMPSWKNILDEQTRWDLINYMRALGSGQVESDQQGDHAAYDPVEEAVKHAEMVAEGVSQGLITQVDGDTFLTVHALMDVLLVADEGQTRGGEESRQTIFLRRLVDEGQVSQVDADTFTAVHDTLLAAGLME
ncbi:MAG: cytochrome c [Ardenticatenaceae bacterium]|nr:cytochrome c [Ardenticatenaceae bacterium]MCB9443403.1 cytochrome c [Ardenticatenaceae bacterium]